MSTAIRRPVRDDLEGVFGLLVASDLEEWGESDLQRAELRDAWERIDLARDAWLAADAGGSILGIAEIRRHGRHDLETWITVHPRHRRLGIGSRLLALVEQRALELAATAPDGVQVALHGYLNPQCADIVAFATARHFTRVRRYARLHLVMTEPPVAPSWPNGIRVRTFRPGEDDRATHAAMEEALATLPGSTPVEFEMWIARTRAPSFDRGLWHLASDGAEVAGSVQGQAHSDVGWIDSLSVRRPWRGRGLGRALLLQMLGEFWRRGLRRVAGAVAGDGLTPPTNLYESVGARADRTHDRYQAVLRAASQEL